MKFEKYNRKKIKFNISPIFHSLKKSMTSESRLDAFGLLLHIKVWINCFFFWFDKNKTFAIRNEWKWFPKKIVLKRRKNRLKKNKLQIEKKKKCKINCSEKEKSNLNATQTSFYIHPFRNIEFLANFLRIAIIRGLILANTYIYVCIYQS